MDKQTLFEQELYVVASSITKMPYVFGDEFFMLYSDKEKAIKYARSIHPKELVKYNKDTVINTSVITNKEKFADMMLQLGYTKFLFNGEGKIFDLAEIFKSANKITDEKKAVYNALLSYEKMSESSHIGKAKAAKIAGLRNSLLSEKYISIVNDLKKTREQLNDCYTKIDDGEDETRIERRLPTAIIAGLDQRGCSYGKTSLGWGAASIFLSTLLVPCILGIVYGIKSIKYTDSIGEAVDKKAMVGIILSLFSSMIFVSMILSVME